MKEIISGSKSGRFGLMIFMFVVVLSIAAALGYFFVDGSVISRLSSEHRNLDDFAGAKLIKALGKVYVPLWLLFLWGYSKNRLQIVLAGSLAMLLTLAIVSPVKIITHRERPRDAAQSSVVTKSKAALRGQSFPSADTATVFASAVVVSPFVSVLGLSVLFIFAGAVGFLRIACLAHYPSDVLAGAAFGIFCGWLALKISEQWLSKNSFRIAEWWRKVVLVGLILIPLLNVFFGGFEQLLVFLAGSAAVSGCVYLASTISGLRRKNAAL